MEQRRVLRKQLRYGKDLVESGVSGLRSGRDSHLNGKALSTVLSQSARASLGLATIGASAALLRLYLNDRRSRFSKAVAFGVAGSAMGFLAGFAWQTRELTADMGCSAWKQMGAVRDEHWLERHPIDYA